MWRSHIVTPYIKPIQISSKLGLILFWLTRTRQMFLYWWKFWEVQKKMRSRQSKPPYGMRSLQLQSVMALLLDVLAQFSVSQFSCRWSFDLFNLPAGTEKFTFFPSTFVEAKISSKRNFWSTGKSFLNTFRLSILTSLRSFAAGKKQRDTYITVLADQLSLTSNFKLLLKTANSWVSNSSPCNSNRICFFLTP